MVMWVCLVALLVTTVPAAAQLVLPPGFGAEPYVTGRGFDAASERGARGIPAASTLGFDETGTLYLAKTGARYRLGEAEDLGPLYRIPPGPAQLAPDVEARFFHGPPLWNPLVGAVRGRGEILVTTYDRDRRIGALYRLLDGRASLVAGGTPVAGQPPLLRHPEGVALDATGNIHVADREQGVVVRLDPAGKVLDPRHVSVRRPRMLTFDASGHLWISSDGTAESPFQDGIGEILRLDREGRVTSVLRGPLTAGMTVSPGGMLFVGQRRTGQIFVLTADGRRIDFAGGADGTAIRALAFAPVTPETRRLGIAGHLFVIVVSQRVWAVNEVVRVWGPFDEFVRQHLKGGP
jgi:hypothetical protein